MTLQNPPELHLQDTFHPGDSLDVTAWADGTVTVTVEHHKGPSREWQVRLTASQFAELQSWRPTEQAGISYATEQNGVSYS